MLENNDVNTLLSSSINKINGVIDCLPNELQDYMREARDNISDVIMNLGYKNVILNEGEYHGFLDMVSLHLTLNNISKDLGIITLFIPDNIKLEDALYNVNIVMKKMALLDGVFDCCYSSHKKRVLK